MGVILPQTGSGADQAEWQRQGIELAKEEINNAGGLHGLPVELIYEDSKGGDPKEALSAYQKLTAFQPLTALLTWGSGVGIALTNFSNQDHVIQMGIATASPAYSTPNDYTFRDYPSSVSEGAFLADLVFNQLHYSKIAILYINNDYGLGMKKAFSKKYSELGGTIVAEEAFDKGTTDVRTELTNIQSTQPQALFLTTYPLEGAIIVTQAKELGLKLPFIASTAILGGKGFFDVAGNSAEGLLASRQKFDPSDPNPTTQTFTKLYKTKYGTDPNIYSVWAYDGLKVLASAMKICEDPKDTLCIKDQLLATRDYPGAIGKISFDKNGDIQADFQVFVVKGERFEPYAIPS